MVAEFGDATVLVGSAGLLEKYGAKVPGAGSGSVVHVAEKRNGEVRYLGHIALADPVKPESAAAVAQLHAMKLRTVLLSGDGPAAVEAAAKAVGITEVRAGVKPGEKADFVRSLQKETTVAMVGDGINDAPALAAADLGIAIGSGSDVAKEVGGIVLVGGSLLGVAAAIRLSRATMRCVRQNLFLAFVYNVLAIPGRGDGFTQPALGGSGDGTVGCDGHWERPATET